MDLGMGIAHINRALWTHMEWKNKFYENYFADSENYFSEARNNFYEKFIFIFTENVLQKIIFIK